MALTTLTHTGRSGDADLFLLTLEDGSEHRFVVTKAEREADPDAPVKALGRIMDRVRQEAKANG